MKQMNGTIASLLFAAAALTYPLGIAAQPNSRLQNSSTKLIEESRCSDAVKSCFAYSGNEFTNCLYQTSKQPHCAKNELGQLAAKRWGMSPIKEIQGPAPSLVGPQLIDTQCLANFDSKWSAALIDGKISSEAIKNLSAELDNCAKQASNELLRP